MTSYVRVEASMMIHSYSSPVWTSVATEFPVPQDGNRDKMEKRLARNYVKGVYD